MGRKLASALNAAAFAVELVFAVPVLGRLLKWAWSLVLTGVWGVAGLADLALGLAGIQPQRKLRVRVVILRDEAGRPVAEPGDVAPHLREAIEIFGREAKVRIVPIEPSVVVSPRPSGPAALDLRCDWVGSTLQDLGSAGAAFELLASREAFSGNLRRLVGYGAPIVIFVVRGFKTPHLGCSLGPLTDYVTVAGRKPTCIAHELGHACNLPHSRHDDNLMYRKCGRTRLDRWQVAVVRSSRHVTYF